MTTPRAAALTPPPLADQLVDEDTAAGLARPVEGTDSVPTPELLARLAALGDDRTPVGIYWHPDATRDGACDVGGPGWAVEVADSTFHGGTAEEAIRRAEEHARC